MNITRSAKTTISILFLFGVFQSAYAGGMLSASKEVYLDANAETVWKMIGNYNHLDVWHPAVVETSLQGTGEMEGDIRILTLGNGATITEVLLSHDNNNYSYRYKITDSPLPVADYVSSVSVYDEGNMKSRVVWESTFTEFNATATEAEDAINGVYAAGLGTLEKHFNGQ